MRLAEALQLVADENIPAGLVSTLRQQGIRVIYIAELEPGLDDRHVFALAVDRACCLLTEDHDFGELIFRQQLACPGIVLLRLPPLYQDHWHRIASILGQRAGGLMNNFTVIESKRVRVRRLPNH